MRVGIAAFFVFRVVIFVVVRIVILKRHGAIFGNRRFNRRNSLFVIVFMFRDMNRIFKSIFGILKGVDSRVVAGHRSPPAGEQRRDFRRSACGGGIISRNQFAVGIVQRIGLSSLHSVRSRDRVKIKGFACYITVYSRFQYTRFRCRYGRICPAKICVSLTFYRRYKTVISSVVFSHRDNFFRTRIIRH